MYLRNTFSKRRHKCKHSNIIFWQNSTNCVGNTTRLMVLSDSTFYFTYFAWTANSNCGQETVHHWLVGIQNLCTWMVWCFWWMQSLLHLRLWRQATCLTYRHSHSHVTQYHVTLYCTSYVFLNAEFIFILLPHMKTNAAPLRSYIWKIFGKKLWEQYLE
jgi:hypothetical protein